MIDPSAPVTFTVGDELRYNIRGGTVATANYASDIEPRVLTLAGSHPVHNVVDYGACGDGHADDTAAIDAALAAAAPTGGVVVFPAGVYLTKGSHIVPAMVRVVGAGVGATRIAHYEAGACITVTAPGVSEHRTGISDLLIVGTSSGGAGVEFRDVSFGAWAERVRVRGYTNGAGFQLHNAGSGQFTEGAQLLNCSSSDNAVGVRFKRTGGTRSFKGFYCQQFALNVPGNGAGFDFGVGQDAAHDILVYHGFFHGHIWFDGKAGNAGWDVGQYATVRDGSVFMSGEGAHATSRGIRNTAGGAVSLFGSWPFGQIGHDIDPARTLIGTGGNSNFGGAAGNQTVQDFVAGKNQTEDITGWYDHNNTNEFLRGQKWFAISRLGRPKWCYSGNRSSSATAGAGSALPATPETYLLVEDENGRVLKIPAYK